MFDEHDVQEFIDIFLEAKEPLTLEEVGNRWAAKHLRICFNEDLINIKIFLNAHDIFERNAIPEKTWRLYTDEPNMRVAYWEWYDTKTGNGSIKETEIFYSTSWNKWREFSTLKPFDTKKITKIIWKNF